MMHVGISLPLSDYLPFHYPHGTVFKVPVATWNNNNNNLQASPRNYFGHRRCILGLEPPKTIVIGLKKYKQNSVFPPIPEW